MGEFIVGVCLFLLGIVIGKANRSTGVLLPPQHICTCHFCVNWRNRILAMRGTGKPIRMDVQQ